MSAFSKCTQDGDQQTESDTCNELNPALVKALNLMTTNIIKVIDEKLPWRRLSITILWSRGTEAMGYRVGKAGQCPKEKYGHGRELQEAPECSARWPRQKTQ